MLSLIIHNETIVSEICWRKKVKIQSVNDITFYNMYIFGRLYYDVFSTDDAVVRCALYDTVAYFLAAFALTGDVL
jgi:hypothetical protein